MSKYITVAPNASVTDGLLELTAVRSGSFLRLLRHLMRRVIKEDAEPKQITEFAFTCQRTTMLQLDGEVVHIARGQHVEVACAAKSLHTIV